MSAIRIAAFASAISLATAALGADIPEDRAGFTDYMASLLRKQMGDGVVTVAGPLTLKFGELQANLDRVFAFCKNDKEGCPDEIARYVEAVAQVSRSLNAPPKREAIRIAVRTVEYARQMPSASLN